LVPVIPISIIKRSFFEPLNLRAKAIAALLFRSARLTKVTDGFGKAQEEGVSQGDVSRELFERWLSEPPPADLLAMWKDYVRALMEMMSVEDRRFFKGRVLDRARGVAEAAGGFLGIGKKVSAAEQTVLDELASAFPD
jgi:hypothetical protein